MTRRTRTEAVTGAPLGEDARALFAAGAREPAPARLRQALLARARGEQRFSVLERVPPAPPLRRRSRRLWPALSAAAAVVAVIAAWRARPFASEALLISAERAPAATPATPSHPPPLATPALPAPLPETTGLRAARTAAPQRAAVERPAPVENGAPRRVTRPTPNVPGPALAPAPTPAPPDLDAQLKLLQSVQRALRLGEHRRALELLDTSASALENGDLAAEARLMRIEALAGAGQPAEASRRARDFLRSYPHSPLVDRARRFSQPEAPRP